MEPKRIVMLLIDSLMDRPLEEAISNGFAPAMAFLKQKGHYVPNIISSFPTMSVCIDSTLMTGVYPDEHHVPGLLWFDSASRRLISYGNGKLESLKLGLKSILNYSLYDLNHCHLNENTPTIYEELHARGKTAAAINGIVYRGNIVHPLHIPFFMKQLGFAPKHVKVNGPHYFSLGVLSKVNPNNRCFWPAFGVCDPFSSYEVRYLIEQNKLPAFTLVYFPQNDASVHKYGERALDGIVKADKHIQYILNSFSTWEKALESLVWIVMGDSGQTNVGKNKNEAIINLKKILSGYRIAKLRRGVQNDDQIVLAVNERMAYIYSLDDSLSLQHLSETLKQERRIDIIAYKEREFIRVISGAKDGWLRFCKGGSTADAYNQSWTVEGDLSLLDLKKERHLLSYGEYPDVLARLYGAMHSHEGRFIVITVKPGCEIAGESSPVHLGGGAHGSLHEQDSLVPMIVAGIDKKPEAARIVDLKNHILDWLR